MVISSTSAAWLKVTLSVLSSRLTAVNGFSGLVSDDLEVLAWSRLLENEGVERAIFADSEAEVG